MTQFSWPVPLWRNASSPHVLFTLRDRASTASVIATNSKDERQCFERLASDCPVTILPEGSIGLRGWEMIAIDASCCVPSALSGEGVACRHDRLLTFLVTGLFFSSACVQSKERCVNGVCCMDSMPIGQLCDSVARGLMDFAVCTAHFCSTSCIAPLPRVRPEHGQLFHRFPRYIS